MEGAVNISPDSSSSVKAGGKRSGSLAVTHKYRGMLRYSRGLRKDAIKDFNKLSLRKGKLSRKGLDNFLPAKEAPVEETPAKEEKPADSAPSNPEESSETPMNPVLSSVQMVAAAIKTLRKELPKLSGKDKETAITALSELVG